MKSHTLTRFVTPPPPPAPTCAACKAYRPEVVVPLGEGALELCWLCAHHHVDHGVPLSECATAECEHTPDEIYPAVSVGVLPNDPGRAARVLRSLERDLQVGMFDLRGYESRSGDCAPCRGYGVIAVDADNVVACQACNGTGGVVEIPAWRRGRGPDKTPRARRTR